MVIEVYVNNRLISSPGETESLLIERWNLQWYRTPRTGEAAWAGWSRTPIEKTIVGMLRRVAISSRVTQISRLMKRNGYGEQFDVRYKIIQKPSTLHFGPTDVTKDVIFHGHKGHMYLDMGNQCSLSFFLSYRHNLWTPPTLPTHIAPITILDNYVSRSATPPNQQHAMPYDNNNPSTVVPSSSAPKLTSGRTPTSVMPSSSSPSHITITPPHHGGGAMSSHPAGTSSSYQSHHQHHHQRHPSGGSHTPTIGSLGRPTVHLHHPPSSQSPDLDEYSVRLGTTSLPRQEYLEQHYRDLHQPTAHQDHPTSPRSLTGGSGHASPSFLGQSPVPGTSPSPSDSSFMRPVRGRSTSASASQILGSTSISPYRIDLNSTMARSPPMPSIGSANNNTGLPLDMIGPSAGRYPSGTSITSSTSPAIPAGASYRDFSSPSVTERLTSEISFGHRSDSHSSPYFPGSAGELSFGHAPAPARYSWQQESSEQAWEQIPLANRPAVITEELRNISTVTPLSFHHNGDLGLFQEIMAFQARH